MFCSFIHCICIWESTNCPPPCFWEHFADPVMKPNFSRVTMHSCDSFKLAADACCAVILYFQAAEVGVLLSACIKGIAELWYSVLLNCDIVNLPLQLSILHTLRLSLQKALSLKESIVYIYFKDSFLTNFKICSCYHAVCICSISLEIDS